MTESASKKTEEFLKVHPHIKECLLKGVVNYTALANHIISHEKLDTSIGAVIIALQRYKRKHEKKPRNKDVLKILQKSEIDVKTKISTLVVRKQSAEDILEVQKKIKLDGGYVQAIEGDSTYTIVTSEKHTKEIEKHYSHNVLYKRTGQALFLLKSPSDIETTPGIMSHLYSLLSANGINVLETMSCWTDTLFLVEMGDFNKVVEILKF